ncbi:MAG: hypothetical protein JXA20_19425 [Spirochaetes bacterium]|nr:hypothetical protein [Spirochaetota bacterium]
MKRKLLFVLFADDVCRQNHAFMYALDLHRQGHETRIIVEGPATRLFDERLGDRESKFYGLFAEAKELGLIAGACGAASAGCANRKDDVVISDLVSREGVNLLSGMYGHAGIGSYADQGYELVIV